MAHADRIIDLGRGAGRDDGRIVVQGTPGDLVAARPASPAGTSRPTSAPDRAPRRHRKTSSLAPTDDATESICHRGQCSHASSERRMAKTATPHLML
jgi:hypothetical protein